MGAATAATAEEFAEEPASEPAPISEGVPPPSPAADGGESELMAALAARGRAE